MARFTESLIAEVRGELSSAPAHAATAIAASPWGNAEAMEICAEVS